jgi:hypothetical protein
MTGAWKILDKYIQSFLVGKSKGNRHSENLCLDSRIILKLTMGEIGWKFVDWVLLAQDKDKWLSITSTVMNFQVP